MNARGSGSSPAKGSMVAEAVAGHRERLRRRFAQAGPSSFADHELLELLLSFAIPRKDVKPLAKRLLAEFGDLAGVLGAPPSALSHVDGLGEAGITLLRLVQALPGEAARPERRRRKDRICSVDDAVTFLRGLTLGKREEEIHVLLLDAKNSVIGHEVLVRGGPDQADVQPRRVLEPVLSKRASGLLVAHNHPSGDVTPSLADRTLTRSVARAAAALQVRLVDHVILGDGAEYSFQRREPELWRT